MSAWVKSGGPIILVYCGPGVDDLHEMSDPRIARVAALYRAQTATESHPRQPEHVTTEDTWRGRLWRETLAKSMAELERKQRGR